MEKQTRTSTDDPMMMDISFFLRQGMSETDVASRLHQEKRPEKEIDTIVQKFKESKAKLHKLITEFSRKLETKYSGYDAATLIQKGLKHAEKNNLTVAEREAFINYIQGRDMHKPALPFQEMEHNEMTKFLGFSSMQGLTFDIKATDQSNLDQIEKMYAESIQLHNIVKSSIQAYTDCDPTALGGRYEARHHNVHMFVHPVIVALFVPKINVLEERMLLSNIGRMVVSRSAAFLRKYSQVGTTRKELEADFELTYDIARDPNSLNYFTEESPMSNLLKRYKVQLQLYTNVLSLRAGRYYSKSDNFNTNDSITGLISILNSYDWTYFDSPDLHHISDEGTILRKLLAVFSLRPTLTQLSSFVNRTGMGYTNFGVSQLTFIQTPIINVKLPVNLYGQGAMPPIRLEIATKQTDYFIENKMIVPKNKNVVHSKRIVFFYVNRRYQSVNFANTDLCFRYMSLPGTVSSVTSINETEVHFDEIVAIGHYRFQLRSVVIVNKILPFQFASAGCSTILVNTPDPTVGRQQNEYYFYNPIGANIKQRDQNGNFIQNDVITALPHSSDNEDYPGFLQMARKCGTIFVYSERVLLNQ